MHLAEAGVHEHAIELFRRVVDEYPRSLDVAMALSGLGHSLLARGAVMESLDALRMCMSRERQFPDVRTDAWLEFAFTVTRLRLTDLFDEASSALEDGSGRVSRSMPFPMQRFMLHAARAILMEARADSRAALEAKAALHEASLTTSGLAHHSGLGLVGVRHADVVKQLRGISTG